MEENGASFDPLTDVVFGALEDNGASFALKSVVCFGFCGFRTKWQQYILSKAFDGFFWWGEAPTLPFGKGEKETKSCKPFGEKK